MNLFKTIFLLLSLLISFKSISQDKLVKVNFIGLKYQYQGVKYKEKMLPKLFENNQEASKMYKEVRTSKRTATVLGTTCLVLTMVGIKRTHQLNEEAEDGTGPPAIFTLGVIISGTVGIVFNTIAKSKRRKAIKIFNTGLKSSPDIGKSSIEMHFGLITNGVGVSVVF